MVFAPVPLRREGIIVFTIGFDLDTQAAKDLMTQCAKRHRLRLHRLQRRGAEGKKGPRGSARRAGSRSASSAFPAGRWATVLVPA
jgi:hypothetical protein